MVKRNEVSAPVPDAAQMAPMRRPLPSGTRERDISEPPPPPRKATLAGIPAPSLSPVPRITKRDVDVIGEDDEPQTRHTFNSLPPLPPSVTPKRDPSDAALAAASRYSSVSMRAAEKPAPAPSTAATLPPPSATRPRREPRLERVPRLVTNLADVDVTSLDRREALLLARIDGMTNERELRAATAWREDELAEVLARLVRMKLISMR